MITIKSNTTRGTVTGFSLFFKDDIHLWQHKIWNGSYASEDRCGHWFIYSLSLNSLCKKVERGLGAQPMAMEGTGLLLELVSGPLCSHPISIHSTHGNPQLWEASEWGVREEDPCSAVPPTQKERQKHCVHEGQIKGALFHSRPAL